MNENITITELGNGVMKLTPAEGYILKDRLTGKTYSEAVTFAPSNFEAVELPKPEAPKNRTRKK